MRINETAASIKRGGCIFRPGGVECEKKNHCMSCGWNPDVEKLRKKLMRLCGYEQNKRKNP